MTEPVERPVAAESAPDMAATAQRIEALLDASSAHGAIARERSEELVRIVADLYGAGMERMLDVLHDIGALDQAALDALAADQLVSSLLLVHGLHPYDVTTRVERALEEVRPYLGSHGGDVDLVEVTADGVVRLRLLGSCDGCASSAVTLTLAVEGAIEAAAPEVTAVEVVEEQERAAQVISLGSLRSRLDPPVEDGGWIAVPELASLGPGEVRLVQVGDASVIAARIGSARYAYLDGCVCCQASLAGATLQRRLGGAADDALLCCPGCRAHYDVRRAGAWLDGAGHLDPLPLLERDGVVSVAVPVPVRGR
jgi:Fe-S cluster biogenesis protein NfuA/nitrite reductase/ring-hydroxylating ferredoxin subunit